VETTTYPRDRLMRIERAGVNAWPAQETADVDGWLWRYTGGGSQRANSVSPLAFSGRDVEAAIADVEWRYRSRRSPVRFQICDVNAPGDLDARLATRGYRLREPCTTLARDIGPAPMPADVEIAAAPSDDWMSVYLSNISADRRPIAPEILARVPAPRAFLLLRTGGRPAATALAVVAGDVVIAECVGTHAELRRTGAAAKVMRALEAWGADQGATVAALQAVAANTPAQRLYAALDYVHVGSYHYRLLDT
jgi:GNAT superfamily N-acetyltransferase